MLFKLDLLIFIKQDNNIMNTQFNPSTVNVNSMEVDFSSQIEESCFEENSFFEIVPMELIIYILELYKYQYGNNETLKLRLIHPIFNVLITDLFIRIINPPQVDPDPILFEHFDQKNAQKNGLKSLEIWNKSTNQNLLRSVLMDSDKIFRPKERFFEDDEDVPEYYLKVLNKRYFRCNGFEQTNLSFLNYYLEYLKKWKIPFQPKYLDVCVAGDEGFDSENGLMDVKLMRHHFSHLAPMLTKFLKELSLSIPDADYGALTEDPVLEGKEEYSRLQNLFLFSSSPNLKAFHLDLGTIDPPVVPPPYFTDLDFKVLEESCPNLTVLKFNFCFFKPSFVEALVNSSLLDNLEVIHFRECVFEDLQWLLPLVESPRLGKLKSLFLPFHFEEQERDFREILVKLRFNLSLRNLVELGISNNTLSFDAASLIFNFLCLNTSLEKFEEIVNLGVNPGDTINPFLARNLLKDAQHLKKFKRECLQYVYPDYYVVKNEDQTSPPQGR